MWSPETVSRKSLMGISDDERACTSFACLLRLCFHPIKKSHVYGMYGTTVYISVLISG